MIHTKKQDSSKNDSNNSDTGSIRKGRTRLDVSAATDDCTTTLSSSVNNNTRNSDGPVYHNSMLILSPSVTRALSATHRVGPVYVGVRRVRPSNRLVMKAAAASTTAVSLATGITYAVAPTEPESVDQTMAASPKPRTLRVPVPATSTTCVYKITTQDGSERRMTSKEKRQAKWEERQNAKRRKQQEQAADSATDAIMTATDNTIALHVTSDTDTSIPQSTTLIDKRELWDDEGRDSFEANEGSTKYTKSSSVSLKVTNGSGGSDPINSNRSGDHDYYMPLTVDANCVEQELADLRGDREGVPPVMLSVAKARLLRMVPPSHSANGNGGDDRIKGNVDIYAPSLVQPNQLQCVVSDDSLAQQWAMALTESMRAAEYTRQQEKDWRPMPYHLVPEVWNRLRPIETKASYQNSAHRIPGPQNVDAVNHSATPTEDTSADTKCVASMENGPCQAFQHHPQFLDCPMRPLCISNHHLTASMSTTALDDEAAILELLYRHTTSLHLSCGAKFGCDYLLYDGPRTERHAFAGLRIFPSKHSNQGQAGMNSDIQREEGTSFSFPLPSAYDLTGYVRCLNTAGKLALLGTVIRDPVVIGEDETLPRLRVLLVDLALVKIAATTSRRSTKTMEQRIKNLAKATKAM